MPPKKSPSQPSSPRRSSMKIDLSQPRIKQILANASVGDSKHDFHTAISKISTWLSGVSTNYNKGLPLPGFNSIPDESNVLASVIESVEGYNPITNANISQITTVTGQVFNIKKYEVKPVVTRALGIRDYISAKKFTQELEIDDHSAFVIDFAAVSFNTIMTKGVDLTGHSLKRPEPKKTLYYVFASELENDPAGKTCVDDKIFKPNAGHNLVSCVPMEGNEQNNFYYSWNDAGSTNPYEQFYTKYNLQLSELQKIKKGKSVSYATNIRITDKQNNFDTKPIVNSGKANSIGSLSSLIKSIKSYFDKMTGQTPPKTSLNTFSMNASFQQKRSGDWLQVLLCLLVRQRRFKNANDPNPTNNDIQKKFTDIYFVTHDRIAMAFALLLGVNVIFTHGDTHSAYSFKLLNPQQVTERINSQIMDIRSKYDELAAIKQRYIDYNETYRNTIYNVYVPQCDGTANISQQCDILNAAIQNAVENNQPFSSTMVTNSTSMIFRNAFQHCYVKIIFPNIDAMAEQITSFDVDALRTRVSAAVDEQAKQECIDIYNKFMSDCQTCEKTLQTYIGTATGATSVETQFNFANLLNTLKKQPSYKSASDWTWDIPQGARYYDRLMDIIAESNYKNDKNVFLYNLNNLDTECKQKIVQTYANLYTNVSKLPFVRTTQVPTNTATVNLQKFNNVVQSFCVEVLLNLGDAPPVLTAGRVDEIITEFIKKRIPLPKFRFPTGNTKRDDTNYYALISEVNIIEENNKLIETPELIVSCSTVEKIGGGDIVIPDTDRPDILEDGTNDKAEEINQQQQLVELTGGTRIILKSSDGEGKPNLLIEQNPRDAIRPLLVMQLSYNTANTVSAFKLRPGITHEMLRANLEQIYLEQARAEQAPREETMGVIDVPPSSAEPVLSQEQQTQLLAGPNALSGGSSEDKMVEQDSPLENDDIFTDNSICFHPLLPIYSISDSYLSLVENDALDETIEYEFYIQYLKFLTKCSNELEILYSNENKTYENKVNAYVIGIGLKELFFSCDDYTYNSILKSIGMSSEEYTPISSLNATLSYMLGGRIMQSEEEQNIGKRILESPTFIEFMSRVDAKTIFNTEAELISIEQLYNNSKSFLLETGKKIISDRTGGPFVNDSGEGSMVIVKEESEPTKENPSFIENNYGKGVTVPQLIRTNSKRSRYDYDNDENYPTNVMKKKPFDYSTVDNASKDFFGQTSGVFNNAMEVASGGKKTRKNNKNRLKKNRKTKKNKTVNKNARKTSKQIRKNKRTLNKRKNTRRKK